MLPTKKLSPYIFFVKERHEQLKNEAPLRFDQIMKQLSVEWREMTDKSKYVDLAEQDKHRYDCDLVKIDELK